MPSGNIIGPVGWLFGAIAALFIVLFARLWYSVSNRERRAMENELRESRSILEEYRSKLNELVQRNNELDTHNRELKRRNEVLDRAKDHLEDTVAKQGSLISALTDRCARNEKLIIKLYTDLGRDIDLRHVGGNPE